MAKKLSQDEVIRKFKEVHGDKYDYSKVEYKNCRTKVCVICPKHGEFWVRPDMHMASRGCPKCVYERFKETSLETKEHFIERAKKVHGDKYDYSLVDYQGISHAVSIICKRCGRIFQQAPRNHYAGQGCPICCYKDNRTSPFGVGIYDVDTKYQNHKKALVSWVGMLRRCYYRNEKYIEKTYLDCEVCEEWKRFSNFEKWFNSHHIEGFCLDKDILHKGNRIYSPNTCCFVPNEINVLFTNRKNCRGPLPLGVRKEGKRYKASIVKYSQRIYLGMYDTIEEAFNAYKTAKEEHIKELADKWKDKIEPRVYEAMCNYKVEITD